MSLDARLNFIREALRNKKLGEVSFLMRGDENNGPLKKLGLDYVGLNYNEATGKYDLEVWMYRPLEPEKA